MAARKPKFVIPEHFTKIHKAMMQQLWSEIGFDVVELCEGEADRETVIEFILDANRLEDLTSRLERQRGCKLDWTQFRELPYEHQVACAKTVFISKRYVL